VKTLEEKKCIFIKKNWRGRSTILIPESPLKSQKLGRLLCDRMIKIGRKKRQTREIPLQIPAKLFDEWKDRASQDSAFGRDLTDNIIDIAENGFDIIEKRRGEL